MKVVFSLNAEIQIDRLHAYITEKSGFEPRADDFVARLQTYCMGLQYFPERGTQYNHISDGLRIIGFEKSISIAFKVTDVDVVILGIYYGGQNWQSDFDD